MGENTNIEWAHHTFNPWEGCTKVGPGCDHCYAEARNKRFKGGNWGPGAPRRRTSEANWQKPLKWNREAERLGIRYRVFCASLADVFDNEVPDSWRMDLSRLIAQTPNLDWLVLTKRIGNVAPYCQRDGLMFDLIADGRVWLGATIVNQEEADRDIPKLLSIPAALRFLSMEPLLGPVDVFSAMTGELLHTSGDPYNPGSIDWIIVGGESGPHARPSSLNWVRSLRDQCQAADTCFFFKQWGEYAANGFPDEHGVLHDWWMDHMGKKHAGRQLDGRTWDEVPDSPAANPTGQCCHYCEGSELRPEDCPVCLGGGEPAAQRFNELTDKEPS